MNKSVTDDEFHTFLGENHAKLTNHQLNYISLWPDGDDDTSNTTTTDPAQTINRILQEYNFLGKYVVDISGAFIES